MAKGMSPLRLLMRNPPRKTVPDNIDGNSSGLDGTSTGGQLRQPLGPITEPVRNPLIPVAEQSSGDPSTPRAKARISSHGQEKFPHLENSEGHATSVNVTPEKIANLHSKGKFTWQHRHGSSTHNTPRDGPPDLSTPPRPPRGSASDSQAPGLSANNQDTLQSLSSNLRGCGTGGGSVSSTPKTGRSVGENGGSQSQNATPCKTVSRSLKYGQQGSASNSGASGLTNVRSTASQHVVTRTMGYLQAVKGALPQTANQNYVEHHFELEEDASFWHDHNVQVIIRTRPISNSELASQGSNRCLKQESPHTVSWLGQPESRFTFDHVAGETITQAKLFDVAGLPMVENCISGYNSCMFAYGQTGSGKTHTMLGDIENLDRSPSENRGMTPRVFEYLFGRIQMEQECRRQEHLKFFCRCSFLEIYNEQITDLLEPSSTNLQMREDAKKGVYVENLSEVEVQCVQDVIQLLLQGAANRKVAATNMNRESSRSHSVFTCVVESKWENNSMTNSRYGRLHLVDLAGSERQKSSGAEGGRLKEAANINKSLSTLGLVIMILVDVANGKQRHVPYRDSKLTFLLQDSLGGNSKTIMIANVSPSSCCAMETLSTLKFAQRAKFIRNNAVINEDASGDVIALRQRIEELKVEVDRLRRESILRISSSRVLELESESVAGRTCGDKLDGSTVNCGGTEPSSSDPVNANKSVTFSIVKNDKHLRSVEAVLAGALRREQQAEDITKKLAAEIEQLNRLVRQREEDSQCSKMILRFREEKIRRLEGIADNVISAEAFYDDERKNLIDEIQLLRGRLDRNPELTRFAMENIRLMEELRRYQEFYDGGERDVLLEEISGLRSQLLEMLDTKHGQEQTVGKLSTPQKRALAPELSTLERENELLLIEVKSYQNELKECRNNLNSCLVANSDLARQVDELQATVKQLQNEHSQKQSKVSEEFSNSFLSTGASRATPQETACSPAAATAQIRLETEGLALQQRQDLRNVEEQVSELRKQLKEAQDLIQELSSEVAEAKIISEEDDAIGEHISHRRKPNEVVTCLTEDDAVVRQGIQDRWEKVQEIEMRHSEEITQLQLQLDSMEDVLKEERQQRLLAAQRVEHLSSQLSAEELKLEQAQRQVDDVPKEERQQRLLAEQRVEDLSSRLSAAELEMEQAQRQVDDVLEEERLQRLLAEQRVEDLSSRLSATELELEQAQLQVDDVLKEERQQRLLAEQRVKDLSSILTAAELELEQAQLQVDDVMKEERQQRLLAEQRVKDLSSTLSAAELQLEQAQVDDVLKEERQQRLLAEQRVDDLSSQLSAAELELEQAQRQVDDVLKEERQQRLMAEQKSEELRSELRAALSKLEHAECLVEALEGQQLFSINEFEHLQSEHTKLLSKMKKHEDEEEVIHQQFRDENLLNDPTVSILEQKLQRAKRGKEEARRMNRKFQEEKASRMALEKEREMTMSEVETQAALAITTLQSEILELREEVSLAVESEATAKLQIAHLQKEVETLQQTIGQLENNTRLSSEKSDGYRYLVDEKNDQLRVLEGDLESAMSKLIDHLADGDKALTEAAKEMDEIKQGKVQEITQMDDAHFAENGDAAASMFHRLNGIQLMVRETEGKVRALSEAAATLGEESDLKSEDGEALIRESEKKSMVAFLMVGELLERMKDLKSAQYRLVQANQEAYSNGITKDVESAALQQQLEEIRRQYAQFRDEHQLVVGKHEDLRQEYDKRLLELETANDLKAENVRLENEIQESWRALAEKDAENANLHEELSDNHNQSAVMADRYEVLMAAHERLQQELERNLEDKAFKTEEAEQMIRLSERKAMAILVMVEQLLSSRNELKAANLGLAKEIQDGSLLLTQKHTALAALEQRLEQETHQCHEITEQYQLLAETHAKLQQEHEGLLAENALRVEEGEAVVKSSERTAMAAFMTLKDLLERMGEMKATNKSLAYQVQEAHLLLAEKGTALAAQQKEMSEHSEIATRHQVLTEAHENLRQEHERLVQENVLTAEDGERTITLSERKAMGALVVLRQVVDGKIELKAETERLESEFQEVNIALVEKNTEIVALQQKLEQSTENADHILRDEHERLQEQLEKARGGEERMQEELEKAREGQDGLQEKLVKAGEEHKRLEEKLEKSREEHERLLVELQKAREEHERLHAELENAEDEHDKSLRDNVSSIENRERMIKLSEKKAMGALVIVEHLMETSKVLKATEGKLERETQENQYCHKEKDARLAVLERHLEESYSSQKEVSDEHQFLVRKYEKLKEELEASVGENGDLKRRLKVLDSDIRSYHAQVRYLQEMSVTAEQHCSEVWVEAANIAVKADSVYDIKMAERVEFMTNVVEGLDVIWDQLSLVEEALDHFGSVERGLNACRSKVLMLEEENGGNTSAMGSLHTEISRLCTTLQLKERDLELTLEKEAASIRSWEEDRATLVFEKEQSRRDSVEKEEKVQRLLLEVQRLDSTVKETELRVSDMLTDVQALTVAKEELQLENSRLALATRQAETNCREKELEIAAIQSNLAEVQARLSVAELREQSVSGQMEDLSTATVQWEIERAVVEHEMQEMREEKHKLRLHLNDLNLEMEKREMAILERFGRSQEVLEKVEARTTAMNQELAGLERTKGYLEHEMELLELAASGDVYALEEKDLECFELKRQLGIAEVQITQMKTAIDLATSQVVLEKSNREAEKRRMEEQNRACEAQLRDEIASAELMVLETEGNLKSEVQRLDSSLKQTELRVSEMLTGVKALTVAKEELELEKSKLVQAVRQAEINCTEKEQEFIAIQGDLAGVRARLMEAELREKSISGQMEELTEAKVQWEVERELVKREIEEMREQKDRLQLGLGYLNAEVEAGEKAVFESFRRSQQALERVEARLTTMDQELVGLKMSTRSLERGVSSLDSAAISNLVALEETEHKYLDMQRRVDNAELQMFEMRTATDLAIAQIVLEKQNWEADKRRMKEEKDAGDTEVQAEIVAAELKLAATETSLKAAVESVEALHTGKIALEEEIRKLNEDAKNSLLKVTEQQQQIDTLRGMSMALKAECTEADQNIAALSQLREQYILAEASWKSEQERLTRNVKELEFSPGRRNMEESGSKELSGKDGRLSSQCLSECCQQSEDQKPSEESQLLHRQKQDIQVLRGKISEKDTTILSAKKEMEKAIANFKEAELEMDKAQCQNHRLTKIQLESKSLIDSLSFQLNSAEEELQKRDIKIECCEAELQKVADVMSDWETKMHDVEDEWRREKETLAQELTEAKLVANEKRTEAAILLQKFEDGQATLKEAEDLVDALVKANENAKHDARDWKTEKESLGIVQGWWMPERDKLISEIARLETDMHTQKQDFWIMCKEAVNGLVDTMEVLLVVDQELSEMKKDHQQEMEDLVGEMKVLKGDLAARLQFPVDLRLDLHSLFNVYGNHMEETRILNDASLSENAELRRCWTDAEHSFAICSNELLALTRTVSTERLIFDQLQIDLNRLFVDMEDVKIQTSVVLMEELRGGYEEINIIASQMSEIRDEVVELGTLSNAVVHVSQKQDEEMKLLADLTERQQVTHNDKSNQFLQLYQHELAFTKDMLTGYLAFSETLVSQMDEISFDLEELTLQRVGLDLVRSDFEVMKVEIQNFRKVAQEEVRVWKLRKNVTEQENETLTAAVEDLQSRNSILNVELDDKTHSIDILAEELVVREQRIAHSLQLMKSQLKAVESERDKYQTDLVVLNEQLEMAQSLADERDIVAAEARQAAELSKSHAEQKEEETRILERSVDELESTVYALETQLGIVKRESERQRVAREALEKELEALKDQMGLMQITIDSQEAQTVRDFQDAETSKTELDRIVIEMKNQQIQARKSVESLQQECAEKDVQLRSCKAHIAELMLGAEKQATENQQKLKTLESMVEHLKVEERKLNPAGGSVGKVAEKSTGKVKGAGSPFKCIGSGLEKQRTSEMDEELSAAKKRVKELEAVAASRQKEVFMLNTKLAEAESMTHDVVRDLLGVKMDIASYATLLNQQQVQRIAERARRRTVEAQEKEEELDTLRERLNEFIEERESWLEEVNRRQAEAVAARVSAEKLRLRDQTLTAENERIREDCVGLRKKVTALEDEIKKLSGQQNLQQRIHHHAKIKEENNSLRLLNEDLSGKLRRMEILFTRVNDELARYRTAEGKNAFINFDEEARLQKKLQETEENRLQLAETLIGLCTGIMQAAGIQKGSRDLDPSAAMTALQQLQDRQESLERELSDCKLKARIAVEKQRLSDLREFHTPVKTISTNTSFTASQQLPSPVSSSR